MPQQRSLFSFYSRNAAAYGPKVTEFCRGPEIPENCRSPESTSNGESQPQRQTLKECMAQKTLVERIQRKLVRKDETVEACSVPATGPRIPGFKRIREAEVSSSVPAPQPQGPSGSDKRAKLLEALGADDCSGKGGAWEAAKARFEWMTSSKIRDGEGRRPGDPFYDARTLDIPDDVFRKLSASQRQYWATKSRYMDTLLFFKVGKFYELYELDAEIGHKELDWKLIVSGVGKCRQVGCPESGIDDAVQKLVSRGYKVGRMEQTETAAQARANGGPHVTVQRELTQVLTPSTMMDGNIRPEAVHLLALKEEVPAEDVCSGPGQTGNPVVSIGFAFVDAAAGRFYVGSIRDECSRSALQTLLTQVAPQEVLYEIGGAFQDTSVSLLAGYLNGIPLEPAQLPLQYLFCILENHSSPGDECHQVSRMKPAELFGVHHAQVSPTFDIIEALPVQRLFLLAHGWLPLVLTPLQPNVEFMAATDAIHLFRSHHYFGSHKHTNWWSKGIDSWPTALESVAERELVVTALGALVCHLTRIKCNDELLPNGVLSSYEIYKGSLRLDGQTVDNLELLQNRVNGGKEGTLLSYLDSCVSQFGKRLLRRWICHPLRNIGDIEHRLDAVDELRSFPGVAASIRAGLRKLPDLERLVARLSGLAASPMLGLIPSAARKVHQRRLKTFCLTILGMRAALDLLHCMTNSLCEDEKLKSKLLLAASALADSESVLNCLEKLESTVDQTSKFPRLLGSNLDKDEDELEEEAGTLSNLMDLFNQQRFHWLKIVDMLGQVDVLISFALASNGSSAPTCRPQFIASQGLQKGGSVLDMKGLWHPYAMGGQGGAFVPNNLELGNEFGSMIKPCALLLTGPNMGGKSTLLRATCLTVIMAQLGCFVPCESCILSPVDTIFTRLGASDRIMTGESTFMVECTEAASVLHHATSDSLVVLDELGRGTSTFDGYAIAYAVFHELVSTLKCRLMFATHYQPLTVEFATNPLVRLGHMACSFVSNSSLPSVDNPVLGESVVDKQLVFLYKLTDGACPKSYGLQVALLAGIPTSIVKSAENAAEVIQGKLFKSFATMEPIFEEEQIIGAILSVVNGTSGVVQEDSYFNLLSLWQKLQKSKNLIRK